MKKSQRLFLILMALVVVLGFYGCRQFSQVVRSIRQNQKARLSEITSEQKPAGISAFPSPVETSTSAPVPETITNIEIKTSVRETLESLDQIPLINVCRWIDPSSDYSKTFQDVATGGLFQNLYQTVIQAEGIFGPWLFRSRLPINREVLLAIDEEPSLMRDVEFSIQLYEAKKELEDNLDMAKQIETRAYYAWVLTQIAFKNPSLIGDGNLTDLCLRLQNIDQEPFSSQEISSEIYQFMDRAQIKPEEFKFNPNFESKVEIVWGKEGFTYGSRATEFQVQKK